MATRKENAEAVKAALGISIDTEGTDPKAPVLQGWADRLESNRDGVRRELLSYQLQAALGIEITDQTLDVGQLAELLEKSRTDPDGVRAELQPVIESEEAFDPGQGFGQGEDTLTVQVVESVAAYGGTVTDPEQPDGHRVIGADPVQVRVSQIVNQALGNGTLLKV